MRLSSTFPKTPHLELLSLGNFTLKHAAAQRIQKTISEVPALRTHVALYWDLNLLRNLQVPRGTTGSKKTSHRSSRSSKPKCRQISWRQLSDYTSWKPERHFPSPNLPTYLFHALSNLPTSQPAFTTLLWCLVGSRLQLHRSIDALWQLQRLRLLSSSTLISTWWMNSDYAVYIVRIHSWYISFSIFEHFLWRA